MTTTTALHRPLVESLWTADVPAARLARSLVLAFGGSALLAFSSRTGLPFFPVPMTMQTFVVLVLAMAYGPRLGSATVALYLGQGLAGMPVFAGTPEKGIGVAYLLGPTGGYLVGFLAAAALVGWLAERGWDRRRATALSAMALGTALIFLFGVSWLAAQPYIGLREALQVGLVVHMPAAALKIALAGLLLPLCWRLVGRRARG